MFLSIFEIFKIGIGPSSSHTMGPMIAASRFVNELREVITHGHHKEVRLFIRVTLYGSLAFTGRGHKTDRAVILGLLGFLPHSIDPDTANQREQELLRSGEIHLPGLPPLMFHADRDLIFDYGPPLPAHPNGLVLQALTDDGQNLLTRTFFSIGGGFVLSAEDIEQESQRDTASFGDQKQALGCPYPFGTAAEMLEMGDKAHLRIADMKRANEIATGTADLDSRIDTLWSAMDACINRGLQQDGILPGGLQVRRRAPGIYQQLIAERGTNQQQPHTINDWIAVYAMAVNEENAAGGRVVTAPTNGAAGVIPAVIRYYRDHCSGATDDGIRDFLLTAAAVGGLIKHNASISGAEVGCQGEVGSASAMAAAGLCAALGGSNAQIENAAEIALEHHLGMTCDPAKGLVQVPCIERNGLGAIKAVSAASLALRGDGHHFMPLDNCIETMRQTGIDMNEKYKETANGGLAVNLPSC